MITAVLVSASTFYALSLLPMVFLCVITPLLVDDEGAGCLGVRDNGAAAEDFDEAEFEREYAELTLIVAALLCLWLYPLDCVVCVGLAWLCHAIWLCEALWLPEHALIVVPLFHLVVFLGLCAALGCAYKARSRRRFERACERAQLFSSDPKAFFREKQYRKPALVEPEGPPV